MSQMGVMKQYRIRATRPENRQAVMLYIEAECYMDARLIADRFEDGALAGREWASIYWIYG